MSRVKELIKNPRFIFIFLIAISYILLLTIDFLYDGKASDLVLFYSQTDTGMDFFSSIQYTKGRNPYYSFGTVYPPLANLFFYMIYRLLPTRLREIMPETMADIMNARNTYADLRGYRSSMMCFLLFLILCIMLMLCVFQSVLKKRSYSNVCSIALCMSAGMLYSIERGNIIILSVFFLLLFLRGYDSEYKIIRELALISLAISAGLKLYPALFGVVLLYSRKYKEAVRTVLYGIVAFIIPIIPFGGIKAIMVYYKILTGFSTTGVVNYGYFGIQGIAKTIIYLWEAVFIKCNNVLESMARVSVAAQKCAYVCAVFLLIFSFFEKKNWRKYLYIVCAIFSIQQSTTYTICFLIVPYIFMLAEEEYIEKKFVIVFIFMSLMMMPIPLLGLSIPIEGYPSYTLNTLLLQICYGVLTASCLFRGGKNINSYIKKMGQEA